MLNVESGYYVEDVEIEEPIPEEKEGEKKEVDKKEEKKDGDVSSHISLSLLLALRMTNR